MNEEAVQRIVALFEALAPGDVERLGEYYTGDAYFKDPFNEVRGLKAVQRVFRHMFDALNGPRFVVSHRMAQDGEAWLTWEFHFRFRSVLIERAQIVRGATHLRFSDSGLVQYHRDYWDAAEEVYEKLPVVGALMRWLKRRAAAGR